MTEMRSSTPPVGALDVDVAELARLLTAEQRRGMAEFRNDLDAIGTLRPSGAAGEEAWIREAALIGHLGRTVGRDLADTLGRAIRALPDSRLSTSAGDRPVPWFAIAAKVPVYDVEPTATPPSRLSTSPNMAEVIDFVHRAFPSLEPELIDPQELPSRYANLRHPRHEALLEGTIGLIHRNLGWWAVIAFVLSLSAAADCAPPGWAAWPVHVHLLAACVGGWTLTVVGGCVLSIAPVA
ncbi:hypothetical protein B0I31_10274 [Saccharothrix carnea]|uniref:Uncharacterized protein n=1 Tax=Saccharothrix carnea TaxID=1280637 RepID=A0A2P8IF62_SACCR|nr:hypothetical protein [Saccharothrix carnea]PSL57097.1 hypothetical protein B0I31_10274 [Saccharothrix carnea]